MDHSLFRRAWRGAAGFVTSLFQSARCRDAHGAAMEKSLGSRLTGSAIGATVLLACHGVFAQGTTSKPATPDNARAAPALHLEDLRLLALGPNEGRVVFQFPDHSMQVVSTGAAIPGLHATLVGVQEDKAVIEETLQPEHDKQVAQKQTVWMSKTQGNTAGKIQRFAYNGAPSVSEKAPTPVLIPLSGRQPGPTAGKPKAANQ